jgi:hypothetical protein
MGLLSKFFRRRAARAYVHKLGPWLRHNFGVSQTYTAGQIERGARDLKLDPAFIVFGYAVFLEQSTFESIIGTLPQPITIAEARAALRQALGAPQGDSAPETWRAEVEGWILADQGGLGQGHHHSDPGAAHAHHGSSHAGHGHGTGHGHRH